MNREFYIVQLQYLGVFFAGYFLITGFVYFLFRQKSKSIRIYKIQSAFLPSGSLKREIKYSFFSILIFGATGMLSYLLYLNGYTRLYTSIKEFGIFYFIISFFLILVIHDFYFYWTHRLMHLPVFFTTIHKTHHLSHNPSAFAALSFHPIEAFIQAAIVPIILMLLPVHPIVLYGFIVYNLVVNIIGHAGYEFFPAKFENSYIGRFSNTPVHHNMHHQYIKGNYGLYFNIWDKLMGTFNKETEVVFYKIRDKQNSN